MLLQEQSAEEAQKKRGRFDDQVDQLRKKSAIDCLKSIAESDKVI